MAERRYAEGTTVSIAKSLGELSDLLSRYGVKEKAVFEGEKAVAVGFAFKGLQYRIELPVPPLEEFRMDHRNMRRSDKEALSFQDKENRRRLRSLVLVVKAKLVAVEDGISSFEKEFMAHIVVEGNQTFGDYALPRIKEAAIGGRIPASLPMPGQK